MGFSKDNFEQYRREIRIMWRVLAAGAVVASGVHIFSLPWISRLVSGPATEPNQIAAIPIEIVVDEELVQQPPEPEPEPPEENLEPAASAERPSAPPLATNAEPVPISEVASANTVAVAPAIATENGAIDGEGAVGESSAVGLIPGAGEPVQSGDRINLPSIPDPPVRPRVPVQEIALAERRSPTSRQVTCNPCSLPEYPTTARREGVEGQPVINAIFDENGRVIEAVIEVSSGNAAFDQAALEEARENWRFQDPEGIGGQVSVDVVYVMTDSEQYEEAQQAGEIRAVELPIGQQVQSVMPDEPSPPAYSPPAIMPDAEAQDAEAQDAEIQDAEIQDTGVTESRETSKPATEDTPTENLEPASPEAFEAEPLASPELLEELLEVEPLSPVAEPAPPVPAIAEPQAPVTPIVPAEVPSIVPPSALEEIAPD